MLESLHLQNFQIHYDFTIEFDPLVTTIIGPTDSGKSSIVRALQWICTNYPQGDEFIKEETEMAIGTLRIDGHEIVRERGKQNLYKLDEKVYKSFGTEVPADIANLVNVGSVNFQDQITMPFWFCLPPAQIGRELNQIVNLDAIDSVGQYVSAELRKCKSHVEFTSERLEQARSERDKLTWIKEADEELRELEQLYSDFAQIDRTVSKIDSALSDAQNVSQKLEGASEAILDGKKLMKTFENYVKLREDIESIEQLYTKAREMEHQCQRLDMNLADLEEKLNQIKTCPLCQQPLPRK